MCICLCSPGFYPKASHLLVLNIIRSFVIMSTNITHNIMSSLVNYPQKKEKVKDSWWPFLMRGPYTHTRPGYFHLISVAQFMLNSMRQEDSKWKLMMRTHRAPCVINQHAAGDVSGQCFHIISWTKRALATYCLARGVVVSRCAGSPERWEKNRKK